MRFNGGMKQRDTSPDRQGEGSNQPLSGESFAEEQSRPRYAFHTADGSPLTFCYPRDRGKRRLRVQSLREDLIPKGQISGRSYIHIKLFSESYLPKLQHAIFLDIDKIPEAYAARFRCRSTKTRENQKWSQLASELRDRFADVGHVFRTRSGGIKVVFVVEVCFPQRRLQQHSVERFLRWIAHDLIDGADLSSTGLFTSFIIRPEIERFREALPRLTPQKIDQTGLRLLSSQEFFDPVRIGDRTDRCFKSVRTLPKEFENLHLTCNAKKILRCLCALPELTRRKGYDLPQPILANSAGIDQSSVSRLLRQFQKKGWLKKVDSSFRPGVKAKTYRATGLLEFTILLLEVKRGYTLPTEIADGEWNDGLKRACSYFTWKGNLDRFMEWFLTLPNCCKKDRPRKAANILRWFKKQTEGKDR